MKNETFATCLGMIVSIFLLTILGTLMDGWALSTIWNWFMPPIFHVTTLTIMQAVGVAMVFQLFTRTNEISKNTSSNANESFGDVLLKSLIKVMLVPVFSVGIAYIVLQFAF